MAISWPTTGDFPQTPRAVSHIETAPDGSLRQRMEYGPDKVRRRTTAAPRRLQCEFMLTVAQVATLDSFYVTDTSYGSAVFEILIPRLFGGSAVDARFVGPPVYASRGWSGVWTANMAIETVPNNV